MRRPHELLAGTTSAAGCAISGCAPSQPLLQLILLYSRRPGTANVPSSEETPRAACAVPLWARGSAQLALQPHQSSPSTMSGREERRGDGAEAGGSEQLSMSIEETNK